MKKILKVFMLLLLCALVMVSCDSNLTPAKTYDVGDEGPGGGIVFYVNPNASTDGWTYLEITKEKIGEYPFGYRIPKSSSPVAVGGTVEDIGKGKENTDALVNGMDLGDGTAYTTTSGSGTKGKYAAKECRNYKGGGLNDWYLPSIGELLECIRVKDKVKISLFGALSSTEKNSSQAYEIDSTNIKYEIARNFSNPVFAVRRF